MRHNRMVTISKAKLIEKIEENKQLHIAEYNLAVITYREEAKKQLLKAESELDLGSLKIEIRLTSPVNRSDEYDKVIEMFKWELKDEIELTQSEFNEYVNDENDSSKNAKFANSYYSR